MPTYMGQKPVGDDLLEVLFIVNQDCVMRIREITNEEIYAYQPDGF